MWTQNNTEGFTDQELETINRVLETVMSQTDYEPSTINDAINNCWDGSNDEAALLASVRERLGLTR